MQSLSFKKLAIIGGVLAALLAAVLGFLFFYSSQNDLQTGGTSVVPTPNETVTGELIEFSEDNATFKYPEGASIETAPIDGGGEAVTLEIDSPTEPIIQLQITPKEPDSLSRIDAIFTSFGYQKSDVLMGEGNAIQAVLYKGRLELGDTDIQEAAVVFERNNSIYKIQMTYNSNQIDPQAEEAFQAVISTFNP